MAWDDPGTNFATGKPLPPTSPSLRVERPRQIRVKALPKQRVLRDGTHVDAPSFRHRGAPVLPGEVVEVDCDIAAMLIGIGRAVRVADDD